MSDTKKTYSMQLRLKRTIIEDCYISVPLTSLMMREKEDGSLGIDVEKFIKEGIKLSENYEVDWRIEDSIIEAHPIQAVRPEERKLFAPNDDNIDYWEGNLGKNN